MSHKKFPVNLYQQRGSFLWLILCDQWKNITFLLKNYSKAERWGDLRRISIILLLHERKQITFPA